MFYVVYFCARFKLVDSDVLVLEGNSAELSFLIVVIVGFFLLA